MEAMEEDGVGAVPTVNIVSLIESIKYIVKESFEKLDEDMKEYKKDINECKTDIKDVKKKLHDRENNHNSRLSVIDRSRYKKYKYYFLLIKILTGPPPLLRDMFERILPTTISELLGKKKRV